MMTHFAAYCVVTVVTSPGRRGMEGAVKGLLGRGGSPGQGDASLGKDKAILRHQDLLLAQI